MKMSEESDALEVPVFERTYSNKQKAEKAELEKGLCGPLEVFMAIAYAIYDEKEGEQDASK